MKKIRTEEQRKKEREIISELCGQCRRMISEIDSLSRDEWGDWWIIQSMWTDLCGMWKELNCEEVR